METDCRCVTGKFPSLPPPLGRHAPTECPCSNIPHGRRRDRIGWQLGRVARPEAASAPPPWALLRRMWRAQALMRAHGVGECLWGSGRFVAANQVQRGADAARLRTGADQVSRTGGSTSGRLEEGPGLLTGEMAGPTGFEPATSGLTGLYRPEPAPTGAKNPRENFTRGPGPHGWFWALSAPVPAQFPHSLGRKESWQSPDAVGGGFPGPALLLQLRFVHKVEEGRKKKGPCGETRMNVFTRHLVLLGLREGIHQILCLVT